MTEQRLASTKILKDRRASPASQVIVNRNRGSGRRLLAVAALAALSLAVLLQLLPTTECTQDESSIASKDELNETTTTARPESKDEDEDPKSRSSAAKRNINDDDDDDEDDEDDDDDDEEHEGDDEDERKSRSAAKVSKDNVSAGRPNKNSKVEKGTETELPKDESSLSTVAPGVKKDGVILHSDNPKARAQKVDKKKSHRLPSTTVKTTASTEAPTDSSSATASPTASETTTTAKSTSKEPVKIDYDEEAESRAATDALERILGAEPGESRAGAIDKRTTTLAPEKSSSTSATTQAQNSTTTTTASPAPANGTKPSDGDATKVDEDALTKVPNSEAVIRQLERSEARNNKNVSASIEKLGEQTKELAKKENKNSSITINGRKFDQVGSIECVDDKFYNLLLHDLSLVDANDRRDFYGTYYDYEYAKAVQAIVDTPTLPKRERRAAGAAAASHRSETSSSVSEKNSTTTRATGSLAPDEPSLDVKKLDVLADIRKFWNETFVTFTRTKASLDDQRRRQPAAVMAATYQRANKSVQASALDNYQYLLRRLGELKVMILNGEEALIIMNNRVKKLNQAVGEPDLQRALCSCITSRSGRAAFSMMNELFVDKHSDRLLKDLERAKRRARDAALDTAEFCAYWYGDTIRSQAVQKEKEIKKLVLSVVRERTKESIVATFDRSSSQQQPAKAATTTSSRPKFTAKLNKTEIIREERLVVKDGIRYHQVKTRIITKIIQMTSLWLPRLANWIKKTLNSTTTAQNSTSAEQIAKLIHKQELRSSGGSRNLTSGETVDAKSVAAALNEDQQPKGTTKRPSAARRRRRRQSSAADSQADSYMVSSPFDEPGNYADVDDPADFESSAILQSFIANNYFGGGLGVVGGLARLKRAASSSSTSTTTTTSTSTTAAPVNPSAPPTPGRSTTAAPGHASSSTTTGAPREAGAATSESPIGGSQGSSTTSAAPQKQGSARKLDAAADDEEAGDFEQRIAQRTSKCAVDGFAELLKIGFDQNALMYESNSIKPEEPYIVTLRSTFSSSFASAWAQKRDAWSRHLAGNSSSSETSSSGKLRSQSTTGSHSSDKSGGNQEENHHHEGRSVDEEFDNSFESSMSSYDRGARFGYTIGKFVGDKAARQWPDPAELNTFTYDSLFLAGVGYGHDEERSRELERHIVAETAKRVAFTEANRQAFAKSLRSAYLNGAFVVPLYGVLHAQRSVAKRTADEAAKVGFEAASRAAEQFAPKAMKFFEMHRHQRALAAPYKQSRRLSDKWEGLMEQIKSVAIESELSRNLTKLAIDCGQKSATLMGALVALFVTPEAFETYTKFRGSREALESEFNQYKLGAMRGYELGESWAYVNYTNEMNQNLQALKARMEGPEGSSRAAVPLKDGPHSSSGSAGGGGGEDATRQASKELIKSGDSIESKSNKKKAATERVAAKVARDQASQLARESSASSLFEPNQASGSDETNTNNIFQYMVLNYGTHLVANHSRRHLLKLRSLYIDDDLLKELKFQTGDLIADPKDAASGNGGAVSSTQRDPIEDLFETQGNYVGELRGAFNSPSKGRLVPIKFNILDLGPLLEFVDENESGTNTTSAKNNNNNTSAKRDELLATPLTSALAKVDKVFMKFSVARKRKNRKPNGEGAQLSDSDTVALYLNSNGFDEGDGYMCGTFAQLAAPTRHKSGPAADDDNELSLEAMMLDELFERIERAPESLATVELTESVMGMTTVAPKRIESIEEPQDHRRASSSKAPAPMVATTTTNAPGRTTRQPTASKQTKPEQSGEPKIGSSRSADVVLESTSSTTAGPKEKRVSKTSTTTTERPAEDETTTTTAAPADDNNVMRETKESATAADDDNSDVDTDVDADS